MAKPNGHLKQIQQPWIGWGVVAVLLALTGFLGRIMLEDLKIRVAEIERETKAIQLAITTERGRTDAMQAQVATVTRLLDGIAESYRSIDNRLTRMELVSENQRLKNIK